MKKILIFTLVLILIGSSFVLSCFADYTAYPQFGPIYAYGLPSDSGYWSPITYSLGGTFCLWDDSINIVPISVSNEWSILRDDRDENGDGLCFWVLNAWIRKFAFIENVFDLNNISAIKGYYYNTIQIVVRTYDQEPTGYLNDINILGEDLAFNPLKVVLYHNDTDPALDVYLKNSGLFFGYSGDPQHIFLNDWSLEFRQRFMFDFFGGYQIDDAIQGYLGVWRPVSYSLSYDPDDPSAPDLPSDPDDPTVPPGGGSGSVDSPAAGFTAFMRVIIEGFKDLLMIEFFGGFFSLADILGVIVSFSLLVLFVKWFAGG